MYLGGKIRLCVREFGAVISREQSVSRPWGSFARTGLCCQCEGESIAEPGGSASGPWPASAWFGKSCGSIELTER